MNQQLKQTLTVKTARGKESYFREDLLLKKKNYQNPLELKTQTRPIDPRLLQRYSFDDNGGGYKGL